MPTYFADVAGLGGSPNNSNAGGITTPWLNLGVNLHKLTAGDTLNVRGGTYASVNDVMDSNLVTFPGGTSGHPITIQNYNGESAIVNTPDGYNPLGLNSGTQTWITVSGLIFDGTGAVNTNIQGIYISGTASQIQITLCSVRNWPNFGIQVSNNNGAANAITIYGCSIHGNGSGGLITNGHGIYNTGGGTVTIDTCLIHDNLGYGIHSYEDDGFYNISGCIYRNNTIYNQGRSPGTVPSYGIVCAGGQNTLVYNNLLYNNYGGINVYSLELNCGVYNNTITGNQPGNANANGGIDLQYYGSAPTIENNINFNNETTYNDYGGTGTPIHSNDYTSDPAFVNAGAGNYQLQGTSGAIGTGLNLAALFTSDLLGNGRVVPWTAGAYQYYAPGSAVLARRTLSAMGMRAGGRQRQGS